MLAECALLIISKTDSSHEVYKHTSEQLVFSPSQQSQNSYTGHKDQCTAHAHLTGFTSIRQSKRGLWTTDECLCSLSVQQLYHLYKLKHRRSDSRSWHGTFNGI